MRIQFALSFASMVNGAGPDPCRELDALLALGAGSYTKGTVCQALAWKVVRGSGPICFHSTTTRDACPGKHPVYVREALDELRRLTARTETTPAPEAERVAAVVGNLRPDEPVMLEPFRSEAATMELLVMGDIGHSNCLFTKTVKTTAEKLGHIVSAGIVLGDNFYTHGVTSVEDPLFKAVFVDILTQRLPNIPFHMILGNHDHLGNISAQVEYSSRNPQWIMPSFHYRRNFVSGDGAVTCIWFLDTDPLAYKQRLRDPAQLSWLDATLADPECRWKIVVGHHPVYDAGEYGDNKRMVARVLPVMERHGVHIYMSGHEHQTQVLHNPEVSPITFVITGLTSEKRGVHCQADHPVCIWQDVKNLAVVQLSINRDAIKYTVHKASGEIDEAPLYAGAIH